MLAVSATREERSKNTRFKVRRFLGHAPRGETFAGSSLSRGFIAGVPVDPSQPAMREAGRQGAAKAPSRILLQMTISSCIIPSRIVHRKEEGRKCCVSFI